MENLGEKVSFRLTDNELSFIDAVRWDDKKKKFVCSRSAALRQIIDGYKFVMMSPLSEIIEAARSDKPLEILKENAKAKGTETEPTQPEQPQPASASTGS